MVQTRKRVAMEEQEWLEEKEFLTSLNDPQVGEHSDVGIGAPEVVDGHGKNNLSDSEVCELDDEKALVNAKEDQLTSGLEGVLL